MYYKIWDIILYFICDFYNLENELGIEKKQAFLSYIPGLEQ